MKDKSWILKSSWGICIGFLLAVSFHLQGQPLEPSVHRAPVVAGTFYPSDQKALESTLGKLFEEAESIKFEGIVQSLIVPHAGYDYSGIVAASGYKSIPRNHNYSNIFIIATSQREQFEGSSVYSVGNYLTPLGTAKVNTDLAIELIRANETLNFHAKAHDREHSIEVQVPFIQYHFIQTPPIVPIVLGSSSIATARDLAIALLPYFTPDNLFIISTDFSHYPEYNDARRIDKRTGDAILSKDPRQFYSILRKSSEEAVQNLSTPCSGWSSVMTMLYMAERKEQMKIKPILYKNSGDAALGDKRRVVGYWSMAGHLQSADEEGFKLDKTDQEALLDISRNTLESYLKSQDMSMPPDMISRTILTSETGVFVNLYMGGRVRGSAGSFYPSKPLYLLVQEMTLAAAMNDENFAPVEETELPYIEIEISIVTPLSKINSIEEIQIGKHGIYMARENKSGSYLPRVALENHWSVEDFLGYCAREKAGIGWDGWKDAELYVFEAIVFGEEKRK